MYYRRKILLAVLEAFGGSVNNLKFQKYLFLIMERLRKKYYYFVPYKYGCFSFESYSDKRSLNDYLKEDKNGWVLTCSGVNKDYQFVYEITQEDKEQILAVKTEYGKLSQSKLLNIIYSRYPYYAINSEIIARANLNAEEKKEIENSKPKQEEKCLFTLGYEGRSIDEYLNILIKNNIKILCDVRKNPLSRKYGFSKNSLQKNTQNLGIEYLHIPELGIQSNLRNNLNTKQDYRNLFSFYEKRVIPENETELNNIVTILNTKKRIALTCFEVEPDMCHRNCISSALKKKNSKIKIKHL